VDRVLLTHQTKKGTGSCPSHPPGKEGKHPNKNHDLGKNLNLKHSSTTWKTMERPTQVQEKK